MRGKLSTKVDPFLQRQAVAELVQNGAQDSVGRGLVGQLALVLEFLEPFLKRLDGMGNGGGDGHLLALL